jgi:hypothetical protein
MSKHLHAGHAAQAGLRAALLAREGFTGPAAILEGEQGFFAGLCPDARPERVLAPAPGGSCPRPPSSPTPPADTPTRRSTPRWSCTEGLDLPGAGAAAIERVRVASYPTALRITDEPAPGSTYAAKFSMQFCVATALARGRPELGSFEGESLRDPIGSSGCWSAHGGRVDDDLAAAYPARWGARVEVATADGATRAAERRSARGDPEHPLSDAELDDKVRALCAYGGLDGEETEALLRACRALPDGGEPPLAGLAEGRGKGSRRRRGKLWGPRGSGTGAALTRRAGARARRGGGALSTQEERLGTGQEFHRRRVDRRLAGHAPDGEPVARDGRSGRSPAAARRTWTAR